MSVRDKILWIIGRECGKADKSRIVSTAGTRAFSLHPKALRRLTHPFRVVLGETEGKLLAMRIVAAGLGDEWVRLTEKPETMKAQARRIRKKLLQKITPDRIAEEENVAIARVKRQVSYLRSEGLLPKIRGN